MSINTNPILASCGTDNMGGYKSHLLFIAACAVSSVPTLPEITEASNDADFVTATGTFTFKKAGDKPKYIACTDKTVACNAENQGELEGQSFSISGEFFRAGAEVEYAALARQINNTPGYIVLEEFNGKQILIGQPGLPVIVKPAMQGGQARADRRGYKFTFTADSVAPKIYLATPIDIDEIINPV